MGFEVYDYFTEEEVEAMNYPRSNQQVNFARENFWCRFVRTLCGMAPLLLLVMMKNVRQSFARSDIWM